MSLPTSIRNPEIDGPFSTYLDLLNALPAAIYLCDANGYITIYNEAAAALWGRRPVIGQDLWCGSSKIYNLDGTPLSLDSCPMALTLKSEKAVVGTEIIIEQPGGARRHVLPTPRPIFDSNGRMTGAINILVDITEQSQYRSLQQRTEQLEKASEALRRSEERYHQMIAEVEDYAIIMLSPDGTIINWNKGAEKIKGYSEKEVIGRHFSMFYPPKDQAEGLPERLIRSAMQQGKANHDGWRIRKDGTKFWGSISITALHDSSGVVIGFSKVTRDLTERHANELKIQQFNEDLRKKNELLRQNEERYHRMVAQVEDYVIILLDQDGYIQNWNKGAQKIKGYSSDEVIGKHFSIFYLEKDLANGLPQNLLNEAIANGKAVHEGLRRRKDGSTFWGSVLITTVYDDKGNLIGFTKVTRDLTDKKLSEEKLLATSLTLEQKNRELERTNEDLSSFAYISSHDLQEPLRKIQTFSDRILELEYDNLSEKGKDYFKRMQAGASRMQRLIRDILEYSRTTIAEKILEPTDLSEVLAHSKDELEVLLLEKKAVVDADHLPTINVIPFQVQQMFSNLLNNALKFSKPDVPPYIRIKYEIVDGQNFQQSYPPPAKEYCRLTISDNGIGFEPEYSKKIFEVFQRLHGRNEYGGTGIGLAICKKIVENHNGLITAESQPGEGATFHIYLPIVPIE